MTVQAQIPAALCALHNFICIPDPDEQDLPGEEYYEKGGGRLGMWKTTTLMELLHITEIILQRQCGTVIKQL